MGILYSCILFDLDGTLTDSGVGITRSVQYALQKFGIIEHNLTRLYRFIGPPLVDSFSQYYSFDAETSKQAVAYFREYFTDQGKFENEVYPGIKEMLESLRISGKRLFVATSKPGPYAAEILEHFGLDSFFEFIQGSNLDGTLASKSEVISAVIEKAGIAGIPGAVMAGDRNYDINGARLNCIDAIGVTYGYGNREELEHAGATAVADTVEELSALLNLP